MAAFTVPLRGGAPRTDREPSSARSASQSMGTAKLIYEAMHLTLVAEFARSGDGLSPGNRARRERGRAVPHPFWYGTSVKCIALLIQSVSENSIWSPAFRRYNAGTIPQWEGRDSEPGATHPGHIFRTRSNPHISHS